MELVMFSDYLANSNKRKVVNTNLGGYWMGKVVDYTKIQAINATKLSNFKADAMFFPPQNQ